MKEVFNDREKENCFSQTNTWIKALNFAKKKHEGQLRDEGTPYYEHLEKTVEILIKEANIQEDEALTVAALHDILEDTECTYEDLNERFGKNVANCVKILTKDKKKGQSFEDYSKGIFENKEFKYVGQVKLADRLQNLRSLPKANNKEKIQKKIEETEKYILIYYKQEYKILMDEIKKQLEFLKSIC